MKTKVMIIDDDKELLEEMKELLQETDYEVVTISDSAHALSKMKELKPHVVLLDLKMSPKSGFQIADELKDSPELNDVNVIAMSGHFTALEHKRLMDVCGIKSFLNKPVRPINLISKIEFESPAFHQA